MCRSRLPPDPDARDPTAVPHSRLPVPIRPETSVHRGCGASAVHQPGEWRNVGARAVSALAAHVTNVRCAYVRRRGDVVSEALALTRDVADWRAPWRAG